MIRRQLINFQNRSVDVRVGLGAFEELPRMFASAVGKPKRAMVVWNDATSERFGEVVEHALIDAGFAVSLLVLEVSPAGATLADADIVFGALSANGITCDDLVVAVGDLLGCLLVCQSVVRSYRVRLAADDVRRHAHGRDDHEAARRIVGECASRYRVPSRAGLGRV